MTPAAFQAEFTDFKTIKGRKVMQLIFEIPIEGSWQHVDTLGGTPHPGQSVRVAIARLDVAKVEKPAGKTPSQRAWALCQSPKFGMAIGETQWANPEAVAATLRNRLDIKSRGELDTNPEARARFEALEKQYLEDQR